jgi:3-deoxy-manno-octulosonate cytidylyltransferase (CMP-KDO synthetase)
MTVKAVRATAIIPARLASTRLPGKVLADIHGKPMIWHVWKRAMQVARFEAVYIATDSEVVRAAVEGWGGQVIMTSSDCRSGTERIASCLGQIEADYIVNVQGDEPLIDPLMLDKLVACWDEAPHDLITPIFRITNHEDLCNPTIVKVVRNSRGEALYFSRAPVPFYRDAPQTEWLNCAPYWGHIGVYGYRRAALAAYMTLPISPLEGIEGLEQLRFVDAGYRFRVFETAYRSIAVDVPADLERVRELMVP